MIFNVRLEQTYSYDCYIEAENKHDAVAQAIADAKIDDLFWIPQGKPKAVYVEDSYNTFDDLDMTDEEIDTDLLNLMDTDGSTKLIFK